VLVISRTHFEARPRGARRACWWVLTALLFGCTGGCGGDDDDAGGGTGATGPVGGNGSGGDSGTGGGTGVGGGGAGAGPSGFCSGSSYPAPDLSGTPSAVHSGSGSGLFEGVLWLERGVLLFSDMSFTADVPPSTIHALTPPGSVQTFLADAGTNGLGLAPDGTVLGCAHDVQGIVRIDPVTGARTTWVDNYQGNSFNSPNDIAVRGDGTVYFSDPNWQLGSRPSETGMTGVYRVASSGEVSLVDGDRGNPNGVALSPDQATLYVGEENGTVSSYSVAADGTTGSPQTFANVPGADGMGVDCAGNLYVAAHSEGSVHVLSPSGASLGTIAVASAVTNLAFGGANHQTLYISAGKTIYSLPMNLPGYPY
jgi:gluconolactonase